MSFNTLYVSARCFASHKIFSAALSHLIIDMMSLTTPGRIMTPWTGTELVDPFYTGRELVDPFYDADFLINNDPWRVGNRLSRNLRALQNKTPTLNYDMIEEEDGYKLNVDVPGVNKEDINISLNNGILTVTSKRENETQRDTGDYTYYERSYGQSSRSIPLPSDVDEEQIKADFDNGELKITLTKDPDAAPHTRRIDIS